jgi:hypothetical protein
MCQQVVTRTVPGVNIKTIATPGDSQVELINRSFSSEDNPIPITYSNDLDL